MGNREKTPPALPKVKRVELNETHIGRKFIAFVLCLALGLSALGFGIYSLLTTEPGWVKIEASSTEARCAADFNFQYYFQKDATAQRKALTTLYTKECMRLTKLLDTTESYEDSPGNLHDINTHPNEEIEADPLLYKVLEFLMGRGDVTMYQGLLNAYSLNLYYDGDGEDPFASRTELADIALDRTALNLQLLGENTLKLEVSAGCEALAAELGLDCYLDLGWLKNAFILDSLVETLGSRGFTDGIISSRDGFVRSLGGEVGTVGLSLYKWEKDTAVETGREELSTPVNAASLTCFPLPGDDGRAFVSQNALRAQLPGEYAKAPAETLLLTSEDKGCLELALEARDRLLDGERE
ncbi:MAG: hypothetical protein HFE91_09895 [Acutalibacter sp.]|jgi:hypothetical protein|uniref:hypothetical protein n=1 Tax=Acutalibacter sp. TaxID=1918636 RepID=UPI0021742974|nr:hypothetical protein [Acutalibacter sp.]MCI9225767.1 hypothetical protein [Acutalibacter sp.]